MSRFEVFIARDARPFCVRHAAGYTPGMHLWPVGPESAPRCWSGVSGMYCSDTPDNVEKAPVLHHGECCLCLGEGTLELDEPEMVPGPVDEYGDEWSFVCQDAEWREVGDCEECAACPKDGEGHADCGERCDACTVSSEHCMDGKLYEPETCECGEVVCDDWHNATAVVGHGSILCLECAEGRGIIRRERPCEECKGTGNLGPIGYHAATNGEGR